MGLLHECAHCTARLRGFFAHLDAEQIKEMGQNRLLRTYSKGEVIFKEADEPPGLYCIHSGAIKIYKTAPDGRRLIVRVAGCGDLLGYTALLSGEPYTAAAEAIEDVSLCLLPKQSILSLLQQDPKLCLRMIQLLSREVRQNEDRLVSMAQKRVRERLAEVLLLLRRTHGVPDKNGVLITLKLRREDLASIIGTTTESLVRELNQLRKEEIIQVQNRTIRILNLPELIQVAGF